MRSYKRRGPNYGVEWHDKTLPKLSGVRIVRFVRPVRGEQRAETVELLYRTDYQISTNLNSLPVFEADRIGIVVLADHSEPW